MPDPHLRMAEYDLSAPVPEAIESIAPLATQMVLSDIVKGKIEHLTLLTFRDAKAKLWQIVDAPSAAIADDLIRAIAARERPSALAVVYPVPPPPEAQCERAFNVAVECADGKFDSLVGMRGSPPSDEFRIFGRRHDDPKHQWFGVEPDGEVDMWLEGPVGMVIPGGEA
jgi:hypothetical protein